MKKASTFLLTFLLLNAVMAAGIVGFVVATGRLDAAKAKTIMDMVRQRGTPEGLREKVADVMDLKAATQLGAATQAAAGKSTDALMGSAAASASDRIEYARQAVEQERLRLEREAQDLQQRQKLLETARAEVESKLAQIDQEKKAFEAQAAATKARLTKESFTRTLAIYNDLKPKQVKDLFIGLTPELVADYFQAMDGDQVTKIIAEFKTAEERDFLAKVLERIRAPGTDSANASTGGAPADNSQAKN